MAFLLFGDVNERKRLRHLLDLLLLFILNGNYRHWQRTKRGTGISNRDTTAIIGIFSTDLKTSGRLDSENNSGWCTSCVFENILSMSSKKGLPNPFSSGGRSFLFNQYVAAF